MLFIVASLDRLAKADALAHFLIPIRVLELVVEGLNPMTSR